MTIFHSYSIGYSYLQFPEEIFSFGHSVSDTWWSWTQLFAMAWNLAAVGLCWTRDCRRFLSTITEISKYTSERSTFIMGKHENTVARAPFVLNQAWSLRWKVWKVVGLENKKTDKKVKFNARYKLAALREGGHCGDHRWTSLSYFCGETKTHIDLWRFQVVVEHQHWA